MMVELTDKKDELGKLQEYVIILTNNIGLT